MGAVSGGDVFGGLVEDMEPFLSQLLMGGQEPFPVKCAVVELLRADGGVNGDFRFLFRGKGFVDVGMEEPDPLL